MEIKTVPTKHIYLDVVSFTKNRSIQAQTKIVGVLNTIVRTAIKELGIDLDSVVYLPTGDGLCIALLNVETSYDIHLRLPLAILTHLQVHNENARESMMKFEIRVGVDENRDVLVTDINERRNVAGRGINMASRIMNCADGNQVLVSSTVFEMLRDWEEYMNAFRPYMATVKHGVQLQVYQYVDEKKVGILNSSVPAMFKKPDKGQSQNTNPMPVQIAYFLALLHKSRDELLLQTDEIVLHRNMMTACWWLARDFVKQRSLDEVSIKNYSTPNFGSLSLQQLVDYINENTDMFIRRMIDTELNVQREPYSDLLEGPFDSFVSPKGILRLRQEYPDICEELSVLNQNEVGAAK